MSAGMATQRPATVQIRASAMPPESARIAHAARFDGVEGADDSGDRAEQSQERRDSGDGAECIKEALELVHHVPPGVLETLHQHVARPVAVGETGREESAEGRV